MYGLRYGGGIGDFFSDMSYLNTSRKYFYVILVFEVTFFIIVNIMFLNMIFGIIIDTFAELREDRHFVETDMKNTCFICNIDRQTFDRDSEHGFSHHIMLEHNLWMYVFFIIHLKAKDKTDYDGTESYVFHKLQEEDISWVPLH